MHKQSKEVAKEGPEQANVLEEDHFFYNVLILPRKEEMLQSAFHTLLLSYYGLILLCNPFVCLAFLSKFSNLRIPSLNRISYRLNKMLLVREARKFLNRGPQESKIQQEIEFYMQNESISDMLLNSTQKIQDFWGCLLQSRPNVTVLFSKGIAMAQTLQ